MRKVDPKVDEAIQTLNMKDGPSRRKLLTGTGLVSATAAALKIDPERAVPAFLPLIRQLVERGVLLRPIGDTVILMPPLTITSQEVHHIVHTLSDAIDQT